MIWLTPHYSELLMKRLRLLCASACWLTFAPVSTQAHLSAATLVAIDVGHFNARPGTRIALLGVDDLIIVQTGDALLIANRHQADAIKKLSDLLPKELL